MTTEITFVNTTPLTVEVLWLNGEGGETLYAKLSPFEQYTQSTYEGHHWIIRDAVSGLRLDEVTAIATPLTFTPKVAVRSETADVSVTLHVHNTTTLAVGVYWLDYAGAPQLYAKLRPGERFSQSTYAGHPWCFRSLHCGTDLGLYIPSDAAEQTAEVTLRSRVSTTPVQGAFVNRTHLSLTVEWIDYGGETTVYGIIAPGERFEQATFVSHPWVLRDAYSGTVVRVVPSLTSDVVVDAEKLTSMAGTKVTEATMRNLLPFAIDLCWVDFNGSEQHYAELAPGAAYSVTTAAAHPWRARRKGGGPVAGLFIPGPEARQSKTFTATAIDGVQLAELEIANETRLTLDVLALDEGGAPYPLQRLGYKERFRLTMAEGAALVARDVASGHEIRAFKARAGAHVVELGPNDLRSAPGTKPVTVAFRNETPFEIEVFWIDFHKKERRYATLRPGQSYEQQTLIHHVWRARDAHTKALVGVYVASEVDRQDAAFRVRSYTSTTPTGIRFVNSSMLAVDVIWLDFEGREKHYQTLEPGGSVGFNTYVTHPWIVRDRQSRRLLDWAWGDGTNQVVTIDERDIRPREGSNPVTLTFVNRLPWTVDVFWLDYAGKEQLYATVAPGQSHVQQTFETHPWRIRQQHSGDEVALYIASAEAKQTCSIALRSIHSDLPTSIKFMNLSPLQLGVFWIDYDGNEVRYATIASRESFEQQTFMTHPWIVRDMASMEAVAFTVGVRQPQELRVSAAATRSRPHGSPVDLTLVNGSGHRVDVNWIDFAGEEQTYATLDPNQSFQVKTGLHNTWRMREATSKSELDLYIAGSAAQQTYRITNKLVRTRERANAELWPGEVALYEHENFKGKVWILHQDTPDFRRIEGLNDTVSSVRVGPDTAATFFRDVGFRGINDVFHLDTVALRESDVGNDRLSSLQILLTPQQAAASIQSTSRLSEEPSAKGDRIDNRAVLRTVVSLPPMTGSVDVWATEEVTIRAGGGSHTIDPVKSARLKPNAAGKLILSIDPDELGKAALMLRTPAMAERQRVFVFPDSDVHTKILAMPAHRLWESRDRLGIDQRFGKADVGQVQQAMKALSATVPVATHALSHGVSRDRLLVADRMPYQRWALELGGDDRSGAALFRPAGQAELAALGARAIQVDTQAAQGFLDFFEDAGKSIGKVFVETIPKAATTAAREVGGFVVEDVGGALADAGEAVVDIVKPIARDIERTTKLVWDETKGWVEQAVEDVGDVVEDAVSGAVKLAADTRDAFEELAHGVVDALEEVVEKVVRVTVEVAGKVYQFVADTVEAIGKFTQKVIETLGVAWHAFVDFIKDIFSWDDILHTHDVLVAKLNGGFDLMRDNVTALQGLAKGWLATLQEEMVDGIDQTIDQLGGGRIAAVTRDGGIDRSEASDKIDWLMSYLIDDSDEAPADPSTVRPNALLDKMHSTIPDGIRTKLTALLARLAEQLKSFIENDMGVVIDAFLDGIALFQAALDDPKRSSALVLSGVLSMVKGLAVTGIKVLGLVLDIVFEIVLLAIDLLKTAMNATLDIPVLSGLYKVLTGRELSPISVLAFIVAVPATIISKLTVGEPPFQGVGVAAQSLTEEELAEAKAKRDWAHVYGSMHLVMNVIDIVTDVQNATTKQEASTRQEVDRHPVRTTQLNNGNTLVKYKVRKKMLPGKFISDIPGLDGINPASKAGFGLTLVKLLGLGCLLTAQVSGNPAGYPGGLNGTKLREAYEKATSVTDESGKVRKRDATETTMYWSRVVWGFQWVYVAIATVDYMSAGLTADKGGSKVMGYALPGITSVVGIIHLGLMSKLVSVDIDEQAALPADERFSDGVNDRRRYGWMNDTFPAITKFASLREVNSGFYYIPLIIHCTVFLTYYGHLSEASVYFVRARQEPDQDPPPGTYDL